MNHPAPADDREPAPRPACQPPAGDAGSDDEAHRGFQETLPADAQGWNAALASENADDDANDDSATTGD